MVYISLLCSTKHPRDLDWATWQRRTFNFYVLWITGRGPLLESAQISPGGVALAASAETTQTEFPTPPGGPPTFYPKPLATLTPGIGKNRQN